MSGGGLASVSVLPNNTGIFLNAIQVNRWTTGWYYALYFLWKDNDVRDFISQFLVAIGTEMRARSAVNLERNMLHALALVHAQNYLNYQIIDAFDGNIAFLPPNLGTYMVAIVTSRMGNHTALFGSDGCANVHNTIPTLLELTQNLFDGPRWIHMDAAIRLVHPHFVVQTSVRRGGVSANGDDMPTHSEYYFRAMCFCVSYDTVARVHADRQGIQCTGTNTMVQHRVGARRGRLQRGGSDTNGTTIPCLRPAPPLRRRRVHVVSGTRGHTCYVATWFHQPARRRLALRGKHAFQHFVQRIIILGSGGGDNFLTLRKQHIVQ